MHYPIVVYASKHLLAYNQLDGFLETVVAAVSGGVLFWALAERHFCGGPVRDRARAAVTPIVAACARWLGLPPTVDPVLPLQVETG
jgi:hypothetical protein